MVLSFTIMINEVINACAWDSSTFVFFSHNIESPLIYYAHILPAFLAILLGLIIFAGNRKSPINISFFVLTIFFSVWSLLDLYLWASSAPYSIVFVWSILNIVEPVIYMVSIFFLYALLTGGYPPFRSQVTALGLLAPIIILAPTALNVSYFDLTNCDRNVIEGPLVYLTYLVEVIFMVWGIKIGLSRIKNKVGKEKSVAILALIGVMFFLMTFSFGNIVGTITDDWYLGQMGLFGLPIFTCLLVYIIVKYRALNATVTPAKVVVFLLWTLVGAMFFLGDVKALKIILGVTSFLLAIFGMLLIRTVTEELKQRQELELLKNSLADSNNKLRLVDERKDEFLSFATHQLRSPLTSIKWGLESLRSMIGKKEDMKDENAIAVNLDSIMTNLLQTVGDLLDVSKIDQGGMRIEPESTELKAFFEAVHTEMEDLANRKGLDFTMHFPKDPLFAEIDRVKMRQVFINLADNAIKYTTIGTISTILEDKEDHWCLRVADTGIGISAEEQRGLFEKFIRGTAGKLFANGSGLGLYIAKKITELHGGEIQVFSLGKGKGTTFSLCVPKVLKK